MKKFKSVLLVDDDDTSNFISEIIINKSSITDSISTVKNGNEAMKFVSSHCLPEMCDEECPQLIFLDLHMPVMDGFDFLKELKLKMPDHTKCFKIYVLSSSSNPNDMDKAKEYNIEGYILKPLDMEKMRRLSLAS